jgi:DNA-binding transcriptional LysR family regulator
VLVGSSGKQDVWRMSDHNGREESVRVGGRFECNFGEALRDAAVGGLGIAQHSTWHICDDLREGRLVQVLPQHRIADSGIHAVVPQRRLLPPRVRVFIDYLVESFADPPWEHGAAKRKRVRA